MKPVLLITPPMVQFNTAYPAAPMLAAFLRCQGYKVAQEDLSLALALRLFSPRGVRDVERALCRRWARRRRPPSVRHFLIHATKIESAVAGVITFLQGRAPERQAWLAHSGGLPEGPRFASMRGLFASDDEASLARHRASLFLDEIADAVHDGLDDRFELARYAESLATTGDFGSLHMTLARRRGLIDRWIDEGAEAAFRCHQPRIVGITVPFPGALYGALRIARRMKVLDPRLATVLGGGFVNTELRELSDPRLFDDFDYVTYDDGEVPLLRIIEMGTLRGFASPFGPPRPPPPRSLPPSGTSGPAPSPPHPLATLAPSRSASPIPPAMVRGERRGRARSARAEGGVDWSRSPRRGSSPAPHAATRLVRTRVRRRGLVVWLDDAAAPVLRHRDRPTPDFAPLRTNGYLAMAESPNPMHRLWSERRWLKLALAHGCYWHRCTFCDTCLDTISRFDPADANTVVGWMEAAMAQTGERSFHFVDEAVPPTLLAAVARRILERGLEVEWWANIRFERNFTPELARLLVRSGCLAVTGGLECGTDRLLALQCKGFDRKQATRVMAAFARAEVLVHAYLMYGYPTQTAQETVDALELVRQLFAAGYLHSAYWHRFALTVHSPAFRQADKLGIRILGPRHTNFSCNEIPFSEPSGEDPSPFAAGLRRAVYNFMHGRGLYADVRSWFGFPVPRAILARGFVRTATRDHG